MAKTGIKYNLETGKILGIIEVSFDSDLELNIDYGQGMVEVSHNHPIKNEQKNWYIEKDPNSFGGKLKRRPQIEIDKEEIKEKEHKTKLESFAQKTKDIEIEVLLEFINQVKLGLPITLEDIKAKKDAKIKAVQVEIGWKEEDERLIK